MYMLQECMLNHTCKLTMLLKQFQFFWNISLPLQVNVKEAFRLCRYDWMRRALEEFLRVMAEDEELKLEEEIVEPPSIPVSDVVADCQVMAANCYVKPSNAQHHHGLSAISSPWHIPLKRLPLTWDIDLSNSHPLPLLLRGQLGFL